MAETINSVRNTLDKRITFFIRKYYKQMFALIILILLFIVYASVHPKKLSTYIITIWANQGVGLSLPAIAQTIVVLTSGIDLSVGGVFSLANTIASEVVFGSGFKIALGVLVVLGLGSACGLLNGVIVVYGRIQPIIATLATGYVFAGTALFVRPVTGGHIDETLSNACTYDLFGVPTSLLLLLALVLLIWIPFTKTRLGAGVYAVGSSESAAYMSGVPVRKVKLAAYVLSGFFAASGGLFVGLQTLTGDAAVGSMYTMNSIAATVLGGTSLVGGIGGAFGAIIGSFVLRTISSIMFFTGVAPLAQPLFEGLLLLIVLAFGAMRLIGIKNRLDFLR
jgi:ribose transport system permease protein